MKLLITTQKLDKNDPILGFFHNWVLEFAKHFEAVTVICLFKGHYELPKNVTVFSLGKEERQSRLQYLIHFFWFILHERKKYDKVFVHMNQIYVVLGGLIWKLSGKKIGFWYTHRAVDTNLRIATFFADVIFTASKEGFGIASPKVRSVGHGIPVEAFVNKEDRREIGPGTRLEILSVGRITRIKNLETLIEAAALLRDAKIDFMCTIVGPRVTPQDEEYYSILLEMVREKHLEKMVQITNGVSNEEIKKFYWKSDINVNLAPTGGVDKVILEGIAAGVLPLATNKAFEPVFGAYAPELIFELRNPKDLAEKIQKLHANPAQADMRRFLAQKIEKDFSLKSLVARISDTLRS
jgi:glycosyltransferase involved in cell wall biosynthesis